MALEYIVGKEVVADCLKKLKGERRVHVFFPAYLAIYQTMQRKSKTPGDFFAVDFESFYDRYLRVSGSPEGADYPWINPFEARGEFEYNLWRKAHLAGSLGGSLKPEKPFGKVVDRKEEEDGGYRYALKSEEGKSHSKLALEHLLRDAPVPAHYTALFFLRDFCIETEEPSVSRWIREFQQDFGFLNDDGQPSEAFEHLFSLPEDSEDLNEKADEFFRECPPGENDFDR